MTLLEAYSFRIRKKSKRKDPFVSLHKFDGKTNLIQEFGKFVKAKSNGPITIDIQSRCIMFEGVTSTIDSVAGRMRQGQYGKAAPLIDVTRRQKSYDKKKNEAELVPHFFYFYFPEGASIGVLLVERRGQSGIFSLLSGIIEHAFAEAHPQFSVVFKPLMPATVLEKFLSEGVLCEARFISYKVPQDIADKLIVAGSQIKHEYEVIIRAKSRLQRLPFIKFYSGEEKDLEKVLEDHMQTSVDDVKIEVELGGRRRTIDLGNPGKLKASFEIDTSKFEDRDGFPQVASMIHEGKQLASTLSASLNKS
ncbi:MAG: hypothetical protein ING12_06220 [Roseomonas sp.]|nr:hypothetical protein [Roseomonas sp.]